MCFLLGWAFGHHRGLRAVHPTGGRHGAGLELHFSDLRDPGRLRRLAWHPFGGSDGHGVMGLLEMVLVCWVMKRGLLSEDGFNC